MSLCRAIVAAALFSAALVSGASAFETTSIGGVNADGSAKYQEPDELGSLQTPSSSPFGNFNFSAGTTPDSGSNSATTNWLNGPGAPGFGFTGSQSTSAEPASPFNTPILRDRN
ncbi:hypothetical protein [Hyphomicrobium sp.]|uniref:hypothetical protein n=1 Tax=Hyphomicrobium sp. TaxID=82 RepID=UPI000FC2FD64|nr:hypothetical protein [Hyphomicrobium sp.]RUO98225.1 MAG: hypothetical protein EKK30_12130 [Hyphomicrobium sp.]